jgi:hypothetical protein
VGKSSEAYKSIGGGSPIVKYTQAQVPMRWRRIMMIMIMRTMIMRIDEDDGDDVMRVINMSMIRAANITIITTITTIIIIIHHHHYAVRCDSRDSAV